jgi:hypothetical protein
VEMLGHRRISRVYTDDDFLYGLSGSGALNQAHVTMTFLEVITEGQVVQGKKPKVSWAVFFSRRSSRHLMPLKHHKDSSMRSVSEVTL